jgi:hypothetical protein
MGGITSSFALAVGSGLSGNGTPASPLSNSGVLTFNGSAGAVSGVSSFMGQNGAVDPSGYGSIGSYFIGYPSQDGATTAAVGSTIAGSSLLKSNTAGSNVSAGLSGTWRAMGGNESGSGSWGRAWIRIS